MRLQRLHFLLKSLVSLGFGRDSYVFQLNHSFFKNLARRILFKAFVEYFPKSYSWLGLQIAHKSMTT